MSCNYSIKKKNVGGVRNIKTRLFLKRQATAHTPKEFIYRLASPYIYPASSRKRSRFHHPQSILIASELSNDIIDPTICLICIQGWRNIFMLDALLPHHYLCTNGFVSENHPLIQFHHAWLACASRRLKAGDRRFISKAIQTYHIHALLYADDDLRGKTLISL